MTGKELQKLIIEKGHMLGWLIGHFPPVKGPAGWRTPVAADGKGFLDLILLRDRVLVAEIKGDGDRMRPDQIKWMTAWRIAGAEVHVWTPRDWDGGTIEEILRVRRREVA